MRDSRDSMSSPREGPLTEDHLGRVPQETTLQRAFVAHLRAGCHWRKPTGVLWLADHKS